MNDHWTARHEKVLRKSVERANVMRRLHERSFVSYQQQEKNFSYPVILLSAIASAGSFSSTYLPEEPKRLSPLFIGALSTFISLLQTLRSFLAVDEMLAKHKSASLEYAILGRNVIAELRVSRSDRRMKGIEQVRAVADHMARLLESAPPIPDKIVDGYKKALIEHLKHKQAVKKKAAKTKGVDPTMEAESLFELPEILLATQEFSTDAEDDEDNLENDPDIRQAIDRKLDEVAAALTDSIQHQPNAAEVRDRMEDLIITIRGGGGDGPDGGAPGASGGGSPGAPPTPSSGGDESGSSSDGDGVHTGLTI